MRLQVKGISAWTMLSGLLDFYGPSAAIGCVGFISHFYHSSCHLAHKESEMGGFLFCFVLFVAVLSLCCCAWAFSSCGERGATLCCGVKASHCGGFSCCRARALGSQASVVAARGLSSCGSRALEHRLSSCGARA